MASLSQIQAAPAKILVVEDEPALRFLVTSALTDDGGFDLVVAQTADEALKILAVETDIECVFTDVRMPGRLDGIDLTNVILAEFPNIKVIITSGNGYLTSPVEGVPFVPKPYDLAAIPDMLRKFRAV